MANKREPNKYKPGGRSPGEIAERELSGTEGGVPRVPDPKLPDTQASDRKRPLVPPPEKDDDPRGIAEIDIHTGRVLSEEHTRLPARPPGEPRFDPTRPPRQ